MLPLLARALTPRRRADWRAAGRVEVSARGVWLDPGRVDHFVQVCGGAEPPQVPLTFPYALVTPLHLALLAHEGFPLAPLGLVHQAEAIGRLRTLAVGTKVDVTCAASGFRDTPSGVVFDLDTHVHQADERVWWSRSTILRRGEGRGGVWQGEALQGAREAPLVVPRGAGRSYGLVSRNLDPIHASTPTARLFGFPRAVVHGMWTVARVLAEVGEPTGAASLDVRFRSVLPVPSVARILSCREGPATQVQVWGARADRPVLEAQVIDRRPVAECRSDRVG